MHPAHRKHRRGVRRPCADRPVDVDGGHRPAAERVVEDDIHPTMTGGIDLDADPDTGGGIGAEVEVAIPDDISRLQPAHHRQFALGLS